MTGSSQKKIARRPYQKIDLELRDKLRMLGQNRMGFEEKGPEILKTSSEYSQRILILSDKLFKAVKLRKA